MATETYAVQMWCSNCGWASEIKFPRGTLVKNGAECPLCGCPTLERLKWQPRPISPLRMSLELYPIPWILPPVRPAAPPRYGDPPRRPER